MAAAIPSCGLKIRDPRAIPARKPPSRPRSAKKAAVKQAREPGRKSHPTRSGAGESRERKRENHDRVFVFTQVWVSTPARSSSTWNKRWWSEQVHSDNAPGYDMRAKGGEKK